MLSTSESLEPVYPFWIAKELWDIVTTASLLGELDPDHLQRIEFEDGTWQYQVPSGKEQVLGNIEVLETWFTSSVNPFTWIDKAIKNRTEIPGKLWSPIKKKFLSNYTYDNNLALQYPAIARKLKISPEVKSPVNNPIEKNESAQESSCQSQSINKNLPYLDEQHPNFSAELKVAVNAWMELYSDPNEQPSSVKKQVGKILKNQNIEATNDSVIKRIASLITPNVIKVSRGAVMTLRNK